MKGMFSPGYLGSHFTEKGAKSLENFFPRSGNAMFSILVKCQEIDVQIQTFADQN